MHARLIACLFLAAPLAAQADAPPDAPRIIANLQKIVSPNGIEESRAVPINGTMQWISVRGRDRANPILLFIHGGPGAPEMPTRWTFQSGWEDYFTVVQWDQRGSGKTYRANDPARIAPTVTVAQMHDDAAAMVDYLRKTYGKRKIFVLGHSWGSVLGLELAKDHPDWLYAYIGMGQVIDTEANERAGYADTLKAAEGAHDEKAVAELRAIAPYPQKDGSLPLAKIDTERKWSVHFGGLSYGRDSYAYYYNASELSPDYDDADRAAIDKGSALSLGHLLPGFAHVNYEGDTRFRCPIVIFAGRHDDTTPSGVTAGWFKRVDAPFKKLVWFENSAHMMQIEEPGRVLVHLAEDVRPLDRDDPMR